MSDPIDQSHASSVAGALSWRVTIGVLDAVTQRASSPNDTTYEPGTHFAVVRAKQDMRSGNSSIGGMLTAVNRNMDSRPPSRISRRTRTSAALISVIVSSGTRTSAIAAYSTRAACREARRTSSRRRPTPCTAISDPTRRCPLDPNRTVLTGDAEEIKFGKVGGQHSRSESAYMRRSPGFEINDLGFLRRADQQSFSTWVGWFDRQERPLYTRFQFNNNWWQYWTTDGLPLEAAYNNNTHITFKNNWELSVGGTLGVSSGMRRMTIALRVAGPRCGRMRSSRPGSQSTVTIARHSCRPFPSTTSVAAAAVATPQWK